MASEYDRPFPIDLTLAQKIFRENYSKQIFHGVETDPIR